MAGDGTKLPFWKGRFRPAGDPTGGGVERGQALHVKAPLSNEQTHCM